MASENNDEDANVPLLPLLEEEEEEDIFDLYRLVETLIENRLFRQTVENSMETYNHELFRKRDDICLSAGGNVWTAEDDALLPEEEKKCHICLENIDIGHQVVKLQCKHMFHHACMESAVAHQHVRCPLCRQEVSTRDVSTRDVSTRDVSRANTETHTNSSGHRVRFPE
jgi:hypothetical protein